jgi:DNA-binding transcriptional ArsR family regulator
MSTAPERARPRARSPSSEERLDRIFGALSDRTRRALLARLSRQPAKISDLAEPFDMSLPAVSKHVRVLERAGLVRRTIDGRVHRCSLDASPLEEADEWLARYRVFWLASLDNLARFVGDDDR